mgnify:CR=1 FL=1
MTPELVWRVAQERRQGLKSLLQEVDLVTVTTPYLQNRYRKYTRKAPVTVLPNCIREEDWAGVEPKYPNGSENYVKIGWAGGESHRQDLQLVAEPLTKVLVQHPKVALVLAGWVGAKLLFPDHVQERVFIVPWMKLDEYRPFVAGFDIGIAPAVNCPTNRGKSGIRVYELALAKPEGMPIVASPCPYREDVHDGMGLVVEGREFGEAVGWMLENADEAGRMGLRLHQHVLVEHTYESQAARWAATYEEAL